jgi:RNA polymerase sigma-70 factor (ECF subfamily)
MDEELVRRAARGDAEAFDALVRDRIDRLFSIAIRILRDHHDAEDAVQQALWTAWCDLPGLRDPARLDAWLYRLVVRASYRAGKARRRRASIVRIVPEMHDMAGLADADAVTDRDALERAFAGLTTEHRAVVVLHHYVGLGLDEIASIVGVPAGTARSRLHYALQKLRTALEPGTPTMSNDPGESAAAAVGESGR